MSSREVLNTIAEIVGGSVHAEVVPRRPGEPTKIITDSTKAQTELGWEPEHSSLLNILKTHYEGAERKWLDKKAS